MASGEHHFITNHPMKLKEVAERQASSQSATMRCLTREGKNYLLSDEGIRNTSLKLKQRVIDGTSHLVTNPPRRDPEINARASRLSSETQRRRIAEGTHHMCNPPTKNPDIARKMAETQRGSKRMFDLVGNRRRVMRDDVERRIAEGWTFDKKGE
jgi:hypothetical protein